MENSRAQSLGAPLAENQPWLGNPSGTSLNSPLLLALAMLAAISPFATDFYLPAFPRIAAEFHASASSVQLCLAAVLLGGALGQLVFGPLSDRFGRMAPLLSGLALCAVGSAGAALAPSLHILTAAQFLQGFGGAAGMALGRAIIADLARDQTQAARANSILLAVFGIAPVVAPWLGSLLTDPIGWRGILWTTFGFVLLTFAVVLLFVRESHPAERRAAHRAANRASGEAASKALLTRGYVGNLLVFCLVFGVLMAFISASPFFFQTILGLSVLQYGALYAAIALLQTLSCVLSARLLRRFPSGRQLAFSTTTIFLAALLTALLLLCGAPPLWLLPPMALTVACVGLTMGNAAACAIASAPRAAGLGSALMGALQFAVGAAVTPLVGLRGAASAAPLAIVMLCCAALAAASYQYAWRR